jgi:hypothetical protein
MCTSVVFAVLCRGTLHSQNKEIDVEHGMKIKASLLGPGSVSAISRGSNLDAIDHKESVPRQWNPETKSWKYAINKCSMQTIRLHMSTMLKQTL